MNAGGQDRTGREGETGQSGAKKRGGMELSPELEQEWVQTAQNGTKPAIRSYNGRIRDWGVRRRAA